MLVTATSSGRHLISQRQPPPDAGQKSIGYTCFWLLNPQVVPYFYTHLHENGGTFRPQRPNSPPRTSRRLRLSLSNCMPTASPVTAGTICLMDFHPSARQASMIWLICAASHPQTKISTLKHGTTVVVGSQCSLSLPEQNATSSRHSSGSSRRFAPFPTKTTPLSLYLFHEPHSHPPFHNT